MVKNITLTLAAMLLLNCCDNYDFMGFLFPTGSGVNKRFEQSIDMTSDKQLDIVQTSEEYKIYVCTDPHIDDTSRNLSRFNDELRNDGSASFGIILGDCTDRRDNIQAYIKSVAYSEDRHEYEHPLFHVIGNHDIYFNGWKDFKTHIGPSVYRFEVRFDSGVDLYIALDSANGTLGSMQLRWLKSLLFKERRNYRHCIILTHTNLFYTDNSQVSSGNMPIEETMLLTELFDRYDVTIVLQGHDHYREDLFYRDVRYTVLGAIADKISTPEYLKIKIRSEGIVYDWVKF